MSEKMVRIIGMLLVISLPVMLLAQIFVLSRPLAVMSLGALLALFSLLTMAGED